MIYIHGCVSGKANHNNCLMNTPIYSDLVYSLMDRGWQVVMFDLPSKKDTSDYWQDGGKQYAQAFISKLKQVVRVTNDSLGRCDYYTIGGISHGGLHALYGAEHLNIFKKYFAILPVVKVKALREFSKYDDVPYFDPLNNYFQLKNSSGLLAWNTTDERVNYRYTDTLFQQLKSINAPVESVVYTTGGHRVVGDLKFVLNFLHN